MNPTSNGLLILDLFTEYRHLSFDGNFSKTKTVMRTFCNVDLTFASGNKIKISYDLLHSIFMEINYFSV